MPFVYLLHCLLTDLGFKALSDWMVAHSGQHISIVDVWCEEIGKCKTSQIELFFRLLNLVVRHKDGKAYLCYFRTIIETVFTKAVRGITADVYTSMYRAPTHTKDMSDDGLNVYCPYAKQNVQQDNLSRAFMYSHHFL